MRRPHRSALNDTRPRTPLILLYFLSLHLLSLHHPLSRTLPNLHRVVPLAVWEANADGYFKGGGENGEDIVETEDLE